MIGIYKITNTITGKNYIGQSGRIENRLASHKKAAYNKKHKQYNDELYQDIRENGIDNFSFEILELISINDIEEKWIQQAVKNNEDLYNKNLKPYSDKMECVKIFKKKQIDEIVFLLKDNKASNIKIAKIYNCAPTTIDNINNGKTYRQNNLNYPIRKYAMEGQKNKNAIYTDEEILFIRKEYVHKTLKELFVIYNKNKNQKAFERMVCGGSYSHVPYYKKRAKAWIKDGMQYRLEP